MKSLTAEHMEPWNGNLVDLTMADGTHRSGLLQRIDSEWVQLRAPRDGPKASDDGRIRISESVAIARFARN